MLDFLATILKGVDMNMSNILTILAILLSPFIAVFVQRLIDIKREKRGQKLWIFRTLMATRGNKISLEHVQALNSIELFFDKSGKEKNIIEKWNEYLDHLVNQCPNENEGFCQKSLVQIIDKKRKGSEAKPPRLCGSRPGKDFWLFQMRVIRVQWQHTFYPIEQTDSAKLIP